MFWKALTQDPVCKLSAEVPHASKPRRSPGPSLNTVTPEEIVLFSRLDKPLPTHPSKNLDLLLPSSSCRARASPGSPFTGKDRVVGSTVSAGPASARTGDASSWQVHGLSYRPTQVMEDQAGSSRTSHGLPCFVPPLNLHYWTIFKIG